MRVLDPAALTVVAAQLRHAQAAALPKRAPCTRPAAIKIVLPRVPRRTAEIRAAVPRRDAVVPVAAKRVPDAFPTSAKTSIYDPRFALRLARIRLETEGSVRMTLDKILQTRVGAQVKELAKSDPIEQRK